MSAGSYGSMPIRPASISRRMARSESTIAADRRPPRATAPPQPGIPYTAGPGVHVVSIVGPERALPRSSGHGTAPKAPPARSALRHPAPARARARGGHDARGEGAERREPGDTAVQRRTDAAAVQIAIRPRPLPVEVRGVHVTGALASLPGKLDEYVALTKAGLNTIELDVKDEGGEIAFAPTGLPLARKAGAVRSYYSPSQVVRQMHSKGIYLIGRVVVFQDPYLARARPDLAIRRAGRLDLDDERRARVGQPVRPAGLGLHRHDRRVGRAGRLRRDHARLHRASRPTATSSGTVYPGKTQRAAGRGDRGLRRLRAAPARPARRPRLHGALRPLRDAGHRRRPGAALDLAPCRRHPPDGLSGPLRRRRARHRLAERRARRDRLPDAPRLQAAAARQPARS